MLHQPLTIPGALPYLLSLPSGEDRPRPILCFLHGFDEGAPLEIGEALTRHGPISPFAPPEVAERFIVLAPQLPRRGDLWHLHGAAVREIVAEVGDRHFGDPRRTFLTGFSFGGNGVFDLALADPSPWGALWPVDPTRVPPRDPELPVWFSSGEISRRNAPGFMERLQLQPLSDGPGERVYLDYRADHVGTARRAYDDSRIYEWLLALPGDRSGG